MLKSGLNNWVRYRLNTKVTKKAPGGTKKERLSLVPVVPALSTSAGSSASLPSLASLLKTFFINKDQRDGVCTT
jgi:hypothetical protein